MSDQRDRAGNQSTLSSGESTPLQQLLRILSHEVVQRLKIEQSRAKQPPKEENQR